MTDERLSALRAELYERFLREDGAIKLRAKSWGDQMVRASVLAAVGNFHAAFEMIKDKKGRLRFYDLNQITHICQESFRGTREWKQVKKLGALDFLLWRGYIEAAREWVIRIRCLDKWSLYLRIYKMTRNPEDLERVRDASVKARGQAEELIKILMVIFDASQSYDDFLRTEKGFRHFEEKLTWSERREYWLWHYRLTGLQSDRDEADRLKALIRRDQRMRSRENTKRIKEKSQTVRGLLSLWHSTLDHHYLALAAEKILTDQTKGQYQLIADVIQQMNKVI